MCQWLSVPLMVLDFGRVRAINLAALAAARLTEARGTLLRVMPAWALLSDSGGASCPAICAVDKAPDGTSEIPLRPRGLTCRETHGPRAGIGLRPRAGGPRGTGFKVLIL